MTKKYKDSKRRGDGTNMEFSVATAGLKTGTQNRQLQKEYEVFYDNLRQGRNATHPSGITLTIESDSYICGQTRIPVIEVQLLWQSQMALPHPGVLPIAEYLGSDDNDNLQFLADSDLINSINSQPPTITEWCAHETKYENVAIQILNADDNGSWLAYATQVSYWNKECESTVRCKLPINISKVPSLPTHGHGFTPNRLVLDDTMELMPANITHKMFVWKGHKSALEPASQSCGHNGRKINVNNIAMCSACARVKAEPVETTVIGPKKMGKKQQIHKQLINNTLIDVEPPTGYDVKSLRSLWPDSEISNPQSERLMQKTVDHLLTLPEYRQCLKLYTWPSEFCINNDYYTRFYTAQPYVVAESDNWQVIVSPWQALIGYKYWGEAPSEDAPNHNTETARSWDRSLPNWDHRWFPHTPTGPNRVFLGPKQSQDMTHHKRLSALRGLTLRKTTKTCGHVDAQFPLLDTMYCEDCVQVVTIELPTIDTWGRPIDTEAQNSIWQWATDEVDAAYSCDLTRGVTAYPDVVATNMNCYVSNSWQPNGDDPTTDTYYIRVKHFTEANNRLGITFPITVYVPFGQLGWRIEHICFWMQKSTNFATMLEVKPYTHITVRWAIDNGVLIGRVRMGQQLTGFNISNEVVPSDTWVTNSVQYYLQPGQEFYLSGDWGPLRKITFLGRHIRYGVADQFQTNINHLLNIVSSTVLGMPDSQTITEHMQDIPTNYDCELRQQLETLKHEKQGVMTPLGYIVNINGENRIVPYEGQPDNMETPGLAWCKISRTYGFKTHGTCCNHEMTCNDDMIVNSYNYTGSCTWLCNETKHDLDLVTNRLMDISAASETMQHTINHVRTLGLVIGWDSRGVAYIDDTKENITILCYSWSITGWMNTTGLWECECVGSKLEENRCRSYTKHCDNSIRRLTGCYGTEDEVGQGTSNYWPPLIQEMANQNWHPIIDKAQNYDCIIDFGGGTGELARHMAAKWPDKRIIVVELDMSGRRTGDKCEWTNDLSTISFAGNSKVLVVNCTTMCDDESCQVLAQLMKQKGLVDSINVARDGGWPKETFDHLINARVSIDDNYWLYWETSANAWYKNMDEQIDATSNPLNAGPSPTTNPTDVGPSFMSTYVPPFNATKAVQFSNLVRDGCQQSTWWGNVIGVESRGYILDTGSGLIVRPHTSAGWMNTYGLWQCRCHDNWRSILDVPWQFTPEQHCQDSVQYSSGSNGLADDNSVQGSATYWGIMVEVMLQNHDHELTRDMEDADIIVDFGAGLGHVARKLKSMYPKAIVIACDLDQRGARPDDTIVWTDDLTKLKCWKIWRKTYIVNCAAMVDDEAWETLLKIMKAIKVKRVRSVAPVRSDWATTKIDAKVTHQRFVDGRLWKFW